VSERLGYHGAVRRALLLLGLALLSTSCLGRCKGNRGDSPFKRARVFPTRPAHVIDIAPGDDAPPAKPRTPADSLAAAPKGEKDRGYAPALGQADAMPLFQRATSANRDGATGPGLLVCEVGTDKAVDNGLKGLFGSQAADLDFEIQVKGQSLKQSGPEDRQTAYVTLPLLSLDPGDVLSIHMWDRDNGGRDDVGPVSSKYGGKLPFSGSGDGNQNHLVCGHIPQGEVDSLLASVLAAADKKLGETADKLKATAGQADFGLATVTATCDASLGTIAAHVGWGDPRLDRRTEWCARITKRMEELVQSFVDEKRRSALAETDVVTDGITFHLGPARRECKPGGVKAAVKKFGVHLFGDEEARLTCMIHVPIVDKGPGALSVSGFHATTRPALSLAAVSATGRTPRTRLFGVDGGTLDGNTSTLGPGAAGTLMIGVNGDDVVLLEVNDAGPTVYLSVPTTLAPAAGDAGR
jgi:hypothetical protein